LFDFKRDIKTPEKKNGTIIEFYKNFIRSLPDEDSPSLFGMAPNSNIAINKAKSS